MPYDCRFIIPRTVVCSFRTAWLSTGARHSQSPRNPDVTLTDSLRSLSQVLPVSLAVLLHTPVCYIHFHNHDFLWKYEKRCVWNEVHDEITRRINLRIACYYWVYNLFSSSAHSETLNFKIGSICICYIRLWNALSYCVGRTQSDGCLLGCCAV
jgi:hypothetical protein